MGAAVGLTNFPAVPELPPMVAFGEFRLDSIRVELTHRGRPLALRPKAYALLTYLLAHPGRTLAKQELIDFLWPSVVVTEDSLVQCVADLRAALGADGAQLVTTVPRYGYRFDGVLEPPAGTRPTMRWAIFGSFAKIRRVRSRRTSGRSR
jgi:DNA-binding winged helix-turn-helix (wHTH) protein